MGGAFSEATAFGRDLGSKLTASFSQIFTLMAQLRKLLKLYVPLPRRFGRLWLHGSDVDQVSRIHREKFYTQFHGTCKQAILHHLVALRT